MTARELWNYTLKELRLMTTPGTWEMIFCACVPLPPEDGAFVLGTQSKYAHEWLEFRLHRMVEDVLSYRVGRPVQVKCVLLPIAGENN